ncbi:hypothetical protein ACFX13_027181 [Malus domestica]
MKVKSIKLVDIVGGEGQGHGKRKRKRKRNGKREIVSNSQRAPQVQMVQGCLGVTFQVVPPQSHPTNKRYKSPAKRGKPWKP